MLDALFPESDANFPKDLALDVNLRRIIVSCEELSNCFKKTVTEQDFTITCFYKEHNPYFVQPTAASIFPQSHSKQQKKYTENNGRIRKQHNPKDFIIISKITIPNSSFFKAELS